jgi:predicted nucleic acid-binding protein
VLIEYAQVARKKLKVQMPLILESLVNLRAALDVVPLTLEVHQRAMEIALVTNFSIHDCNIVAAAELAGCDVLYTEDLNHGQRIGRVEIVNPFK